MKKILVLLILFLNFSYANSLALSEKDLLILKEIKKLSKDNMMRYSLMAIAIKESSLGKNPINDVTFDYGMFQSNIKTVVRRENVEDNTQNREYLSKKLVNEAGFSAVNAIKELNYWKKVHNNNWGRVWSSYNTGWKYQSVTGAKYANSIFDIVIRLKYEYKL